MITAQILEGFRKRISWSTMRVILKMCDLPIGHGWKKTINKLTDEDTVQDDIDGKIEQLKKCYDNHLLVSDKAIKFYPLERDKINELIASFKNHKPDLTLFHETYPFPLSDERLNKVDSSQKLVEIRDTDDSLAVIFCTKRLFIERAEIDIEKLKEETKKDLIDYDKIIGVKEYYRQFFDVVLLSKEKNIIEVRVDITGDISGKERSKAFLQMINKFNTLSKNISGIETPLEENTNFFPLVDRLYESDEGKVCELAFITDEGSTKSEKMRKGSVDLRTETYHYAGKQAVNHITSYRLGILWNFNISDGLNTKPELLLPGTAQILSNKTQYLGEVCIKNCSGLKDYNFVLDKILTYLK